MKDILRVCVNFLRVFQNTKRLKDCQISAFTSIRISHYRVRTIILYNLLLNCSYDCFRFSNYKNMKIVIGKNTGNLIFELVKTFFVFKGKKRKRYY